jgi:hypothetical protein
MGREDGGGDEEEGMGLEMRDLDLGERRKKEEGEKGVMYDDDSFDWRSDEEGVEEGEVLMDEDEEGEGEEEEEEGSEESELGLGKYFWKSGVGIRRW